MVFSGPVAATRVIKSFIAVLPLIRSLKPRITAAMNAFNGPPDPHQQARQAAAYLPQAISTAQARVEGTMNYIASLPVVVGPGAQQRISEAEDSLRSAIATQSTDPVNALAYARMAADLASDAGRMAQTDAAAGIRGYGGPWGRAGGGAGGGFARGFGAGVLGGIAGSVLFDGLSEDRGRGEGRVSRP